MNDFPFHTIRVRLAFYPESLDFFSLVGLFSPIDHSQCVGFVDKLNVFSNQIIFRCNSSSSSYCVELILVLLGQLTFSFCDLCDPVLLTNSRELAPNLLCGCL